MYYIMTIVLGLILQKSAFFAKIKLIKMKARKLFLIIAMLMACYLSKAETGDRFPFKNSHKITFSNYAFKLTEKGFYLNPIQSFDLGYMCVAEPYDSRFYAEIGANFMFAYGYVSRERALGVEGSVFMNMFSMNIPFNFGYKIEFENGISLSPYIGVYQRVNLAGNLKVGVSVVNDNDELELMKIRMKLFAKDGVGIKRHQVGVLGGLKLNYNKFSYGVTYGYDFLGFDERTKAMTWGLNFGYRF